MKGHEYARRMLKDMLEQRVPERLDVIRATVDEQWPPDPRAYLLADSLPMFRLPAISGSATWISTC